MPPEAASALAAPHSWRPRAVPFRGGTDLLVFLLLGIVFFYRGEVIPGFSISPLTGLLSAAVLAVLLIPWAVRRGAAIAPPLPYALFFGFGLLSVVVNGIMYPQYGGYSALFGVELLLNLLIFYVGYILVAHYRYELSAVLRLIIFSSVVILVTVVAMAIQLQTVRRIGAMDADLPVAVNHLGHALVIVLLACYYQTLRLRAAGRPHRARITGYVAMLLLAAAGALLTGSKAGLAALAFAALVVLLMSPRYRLVDGAWVVAGGVACMVALAALAQTKFGALTQRFQPDRFQTSFFDRLDVMLHATADIRLRDLVFGLPWRYEPINAVHSILYPHNLALSILLHMGVLSLLPFLYILGSRLLRLTAGLLSQVHWREAFALLTILMTTVIYSFTSGRLTRIMTIFFVLGLVEGCLSRWRTSQS